MREPDPNTEDWIEQRFFEFIDLCDRGAEPSIDEFLSQVRANAAASPSGRPDALVDALERRLRAHDRARDALRRERRGPAGGLADFEIECELGRGGMGRVLRARQRSVDRLVAIKVPLFGAALVDKDRIRMQREADAIARLRHPGIVQLHDMVHDTDSIPHLIMEFVDGVAFSELLPRIRGGATALAAELRQPGLGHVTATCRVMSQLLAALDEAHSHGVVHRDLKPSNVMIDVLGQIRILDFGLARLEGDAPVTRSHDVVGTPQYLPPELLDGSRLIGPWTDVFAAGVLFYEILALQHPFGGGTQESTIERIRSGDAIALRSVCPEVPVDLAAVIEKALSREPEARYADAADFAADLDRFSSGIGTRARPVTVTTRVWRKIRRRPRTVAAIGLTALIGLAAGFAALRAERSRQSEHDAMVRTALDQSSVLAEEERFARARDALAGLGSVIDAGRTRSEDAARYQALYQQVELAIELEKLRAEPIAQTKHDGYEALLRTIGVRLDAVDDAARIVREHALAERLIDGVDEWTRSMQRATPEDERIVAVRAIAAAADTDEVRSRIRAAASSDDRSVLEEIADSDDVRELSSPAIDLLAHALERLESYGRAERLFRLGPILHPTDFWMHRNLGRFIGKRVGERPALPLDSVQSFRSALVLRPDDPPALAELSGALADSGQFDLALSTAKRSIELGSVYASVFLVVGICEMRRGDHAAALAAFDRFIERARTDSERALGHEQAAQSLRVQNPEQAIERLRLAIELDSNLLSARQLLAVLEWRRGEHDAAIESLNGILEIDPGNTRALYALAGYRGGRGDFAGAIEVVERADRLGKAGANGPKFPTLRLMGAVLSIQLAYGPGSAMEPAARAACAQRGAQWGIAAIGDAMVICSTHPKAEPAVMKFMREWPMAPDLAPIRPSRLDDWPEAEVQPFRDFWVLLEAFLRAADER